MLAIALVGLAMAWMILLIWPFLLVGWWANRREERFLKELRKRGELP